MHFLLGGTNSALAKALQALAKALQDLLHVLLGRDDLRDQAELLVHEVLNQ